MPNEVWPSIHGKVIRLTEVDYCGNPVIGPKSTLVSDGFAQIETTSNYEDGEETAAKNANGKIKVKHKDQSEFKNLSLEIQFLGVDPEAFHMMTGQPLITDWQGNAVGLSVGSYELEKTFALETWSDVPGAACLPGFKPYGYYAYPFIEDGRIGNLTVANELANFTLSCTTKDGAGWGVGPYLVEHNEGADEDAPPVVGKLVVPMTAKDHVRIMKVTVPPPAITPGAVPLAAA